MHGSPYKLAVKKSMDEVSDNIVEMGRLVSVLRCSVKKQDLFEAVKTELNVSCEIPNLDSQT